jgi:hypothetical protein
MARVGRNAKYFCPAFQETIFTVEENSLQLLPIMKCNKVIETRLGRDSKNHIIDFMLYMDQMKDLR